MKKLLLSITVALCGATLLANPIAMSVAKVAAENYFHKLVPAARASEVAVNSWQTDYNGHAVYYTFGFGGGGFVIVSADDAVTPVIGYSTTDIYDPNNVPDNMQTFLGECSATISKIVAANLSNLVTGVEWNEAITNTFSWDKDGMAIVGPLCATSWDQGSPYNTLCPSGTPTGCVATSMAQVMKKWNWPVTGVGSHTYTHATYGVQTANFGATTYDWANMTNTYSGASTTVQKTAVYTLMRHAGVSVDMNYAPGGSGAYSLSIPPALKNYFSYQPSCEVKNRSSFPTDGLWLTMIRAEVDQGRPLLLSGDNNGTAGSGHEWVCDGYNTVTLLFHMNWGWGGSANGYFNLTNLNPSGNNFNSNRGAVIRITPLNALMPIANFTASATIPAVAAPVDFTDLSVNSPTSWLWTFDGGTPATSTLQNPTGVTFATNGYHVISLKATNATGSDIKTKERYIKVGGAQTVWTKQNSGFATASRGIDQVAIVDANTVWAKAYDGMNPVGYIREFTRTNDAGTTWTPGTITFANSTNFGVSNIYPFDYMTAYACMFPTTGTGGTIVKTTDGGATWTIQPTATFTTSWADFVHFFDANNGVAVGDPTATTGTDFFIYTTSNGGTTWTQVSAASIPNCLSTEAGIVNFYDAVGSTIWFSTNQGRCYKSTNMGATWTVATTGLATYFTLDFKDANIGLAVEAASPFTIKKTIDGGATWNTLAATGYIVKQPDLVFVPGTTSTWVDVASYPSNGSTYTTDDGATFLNIDSGSVAFTSVDFLDANTGWAGSFNVSATDDGIYKWNPAVWSATGAGNNGSGDVGVFSVYPVPSSNIVNVRVGEITDPNIVINVYNVVGARVMRIETKTVSHDFIQLDFGDKGAGFYFVDVINGGTKTTKKVSIVK